jgi:hypothetical protein
MGEQQLATHILLNLRELEIDLKIDAPLCKILKNTNLKIMDHMWLSQTPYKNIWHSAMHPF